MCICTAQPLKTYINSGPQITKTNKQTNKVDTVLEIHKKMFGFFKKPVE